MQKNSVKNRRFRLMEEFEFGEKGQNPMISYGLQDPEDRGMSEWRAMIIGPSNTNFERFYSIVITTGLNYPMKPPSFKFVNKVNLPFVD